MATFVLGLIAAVFIFLAMIGVSLGAVEAMSLGFFFMALAIAAIGWPVRRRV